MVMLQRSPQLLQCTPTKGHVVNIVARFCLFYLYCIVLEFVFVSVKLIPNYHNHLFKQVLLCNKKGIDL